MVAVLRRARSSWAATSNAIARVGRPLGVSQGLLAVVLVVAFLYAWAAEVVGGVAAITGSYLAGVLFAQTPFKAASTRASTR